MDLEKKVKQQLLIRGFSKEQLLNNRGLIAAVIDETALNLVKNLVIHDVSGMLLLHDIEELDNIILELNSRKISLEEFVGKVWNKAYTLGKEDGYHCNNR